MLKMHPLWENLVQLGIPLVLFVAMIATMIYYWKK